MRSIYAKAMWDQRRSLPAWGSAVALLILLESALWPSMASMPSLDAYLAEFPEPLREMFAIDQMATGRGFLNAELFTLMLPLLFLVYGISRGARMMAGEEEGGTLDLLLVTPISAKRVLLEEALALVTGLVVLGGCVLGATIAGSAAFDVGVGPGAAAAGTIAVVLLGVDFGVVALAAGAFTGRRGLAMGTATAVALASYVLFVAGMFVEGFSGWQQVSPFHQALQAGPLASELPLSLLWLIVVPVGVAAITLPLWSRRDIGSRV